MQTFSFVGLENKVTDHVSENTLKVLILVNQRLALTRLRTRHPLICNLASEWRQR